MKVGDKIKLTRGTESGYIVGQTGNGLFEIELDDGFTIEVHISEITLIESVESTEEEKPNESNKEEQKTQKTTTQSLSIDVDFRDNKYLKLIFNNNFNYYYHIFIYEQINNIYEGIESFKINNNSTFNLKIKKEGLEAPTLAIQFIRFSEGDAPLPLREFILDLNDKSSFDSVEGHLYTLLLESESGTAIDPKALAEAMATGTIRTTESVKPKDEIDLHIEALVEEGEAVPEDNILSIQLSAFQTALENAIASNLDHLTVIHGVGNGILRMEIHKRLSKRGDIAWFEDANKQKFGYGATYIQLR